MKSTVTIVVDLNESDRNLVNFGVLVCLQAEEKELQHRPPPAA